MKWRGYWVAAPTPFNLAGEIDLDQFEAVLEMYVSEGVHGIVVNGSTGEWFSQDESERNKVSAFAARVIRSRIPLVIGCTTFSAVNTLRLIDIAAENGANGAMVTIPPYIHPTNSEIVSFFKDINRDTKLPLMIYNWPRGVTIDLDIEVLLEIAQLPNVACIKDSSPDEKKTIELLNRLLEKKAELSFFGRFIHASGMENLLNVGGDGNIDGGGLGAKFAVPYFEAIWDERIVDARKHSQAYEKLSNSLISSDYSGKFASPISQLKAAMRMTSVNAGFVRPPYQDVYDEQKLSAIRAALVASEIEVQ
jgi:dihydrodipicolinate synthase/N-acetylneuraminate lyase